MKTTTKIRSILSLLSLVLFCPFLFAQSGGDRKISEQQHEKIKAHKIAFITDKLRLTPEEAEKFWPVYNSYDDQIKNIHDQFKDKYHEQADNISSLSEAQSQELIIGRLANEQLMLDTRKALYSELEAIISHNKILLLMEAEREFKMELMKKVADRGERHGSPDKGPGPPLEPLE
jgi:hypothetical protein